MHGSFLEAFPPQPSTSKCFQESVLSARSRADQQSAQPHIIQIARRNRSVNFTRTNLLDPFESFTSPGAPFSSFSTHAKLSRLFLCALSHHRAAPYSRLAHINVLHRAKRISRNPLHPDLALSLHLQISYLSCKLQHRNRDSDLLKPPPRSHHQPRTDLDAESFGLAENASTRVVSYRSLSGPETLRAAASPACPAVFSGHHYLIHPHPQTECHHVHKRALPLAKCVGVIGFRP